MTPRRRSYETALSRVVLVVQLVCGLAGIVLVLRLRGAVPTGTIAALLGVAGFATLVTLIGWVVLSRQHATALELARSMAEEQRLTAALEQAVERRTTELEDAQRVLQRMWWLGQQITLELNPQRVLERFLEAVADIAHADGGLVGLLTDDGKVRLAVGAGMGQPYVGMTIPIAGAMGRVIRTGVAWTVRDIHEHRADVSPDLYAKLDANVRSVAVVPIARRGERIGAVTVATREPRQFTPADLERIEAMGDLLSVSLENAELVETLRQAEWRFRTLFRAAPDAVFTVLESGRIREANDAVRDLTGLDPLQVIGRPVVDLVAEGDRERLRAAVAATFAGSPTRLELTFHYDNRGATGRRAVALAMTRLPEADPPSILLVGRDMTTEREMRVRLMEADRLAAVGELVAGVAHEVNNPLSSISAFAQLLLRDGGLTASQRDSIEVIKSETLRASQVVKDLLAFARRSDPLREPLDLNMVVSRTLRLRGYQLSSNHITVDMDLATELPAVIGDARQLQQVCLNLVTNAVQAMTPQGSGSLVVATRHDRDRVVLEVRDTGPGIPDGARAHVFEPFFTTKGEGEGTGLGLSVSYGIIAAHGGTIEVASTSAAGTTFRVTLPAVDDEADVAPSEHPPYTARSPLAGLRVLFIDDEPALRSSLEAFGALRGFTVLTAGDGREGLEIARSSSIDVVMCDLRMPGMDGRAFHDRLRQERPGLAARTVFITGDMLPGESTDGLRQPVLMKPFSFETLEETLVALVQSAPVGSPSSSPSGSP
jgi:two-component system NtrC family sensor kinase